MLVLVWHLGARLVSNRTGKRRELNLSTGSVGTLRSNTFGVRLSGAGRSTGAFGFLACLFFLLLAEFPFFTNFFEFCRHKKLAYQLLHNISR